MGAESEQVLGLQRGEGNWGVGACFQHLMRIFRHRKCRIYTERTHAPTVFLHLGTCVCAHLCVCVCVCAWVLGRRVLGGGLPEMGGE